MQYSGPPGRRPDTLWRVGLCLITAQPCRRGTV